MTEQSKYLVDIHTRRYSKTMKCSVVEWVDTMTAEQFDTLDECRGACILLKEADRQAKEKALEQYAADLQAFVMDETTEDTEPIKPIFQEYFYIPAVYTHNQIANLKEQDHA